MSGSTCRKLTPAGVWRPLLLIVLLAAQTEGDIGYDYEDAYDYEEGNARALMTSSHVVAHRRVYRSSDVTRGCIVRSARVRTCILRLRCVQSCVRAGETQPRDDCDVSVSVGCDVSAMLSARFPSPINRPFLEHFISCSTNRRRHRLRLPGF